MDWLESEREAIEEAICVRVSDLLNLDVDIVFYDTTSHHHGPLPPVHVGVLGRAGRHGVSSRRSASRAQSVGQNEAGRG